MFKKLLKPGERFSQRVVNSVVWVFGLRIFGRSLQFVRTIVLARVLAPDDFGLFAIALIVISAIETFSQTGFQAAIIQNKRNTDIYLDTTWTLHVIRGFVLALLLFIVAPYIASFFNKPDAVKFLQFFSISLVFQGITNIGVIYFQKELEFYKQFVYQISGTIADVCVAIAIAFIYRSYWAFVLGHVAGNFVRMCVSYMVHSYRPRIKLELDRIIELYKYGRWIFINNIINFINTESDDIFVGKILGVASLGFYRLAYRMSNLPATEITNVVSRVTFPAYSKLQDDIKRLARAFLKTLRMTSSVIIPVSGLIFVFSRDFTVCILGSKWLPIVVPVKILVVFGVLRAIFANNGSLFKAIGQPYIRLYCMLPKIVLMLLLIYPFIKLWGINGACFAVLVPSILQKFIALPIAAKKLKISKFDILKQFTYPLGITVLISAFIIVFRSFSIIQESFLIIISYIVLYILLYILFFWITDRKTVFEILNLRKEIL